MKRELHLTLLSLLFLLLSAPVFASSNNELLDNSAQHSVETRNGRVRGTAEKGVCVWRGVRYAKAPVGELRYSAPQPVERWTGVIDAVEFGNTAVQPENGFVTSMPQSEDCLFLNIWSPAADGKRRPVMVWIHGGGFEIGAGSAQLYNGARLAKKGDVVIVTINYRLGALGFLYFGDNNAGFENNLGVRDQIAALQWVKENIAAFGGDPSRVTIFGESAGGTSVETLLAAPSARGLFKGAIAESGPAAILWRAESAQAVTHRFLGIVHISPDSLHLLRGLPLDSIRKAQEELGEYILHNTVQKVYSPTIDGKLLTTDISACLSPAQSGNVALMIGTNKDEISMFASKRLKMAPTNGEGLKKDFLYRLQEGEQQKVIAAYKRLPHKRGVVDLLTDAVFRIPAIRVAECQSMHSPVYMYRFEWSSFALNLTGLRCFHGLEIPFVFGNTDGKLGSMLHVIATKKLRNRLTGQMQTAWLNFARYGSPNGPGAEIWKPFSADNRATMIFDNNTRLVTDPDSSQRMAWDGIRYY